MARLHLTKSPTMKRGSLPNEAASAGFGSLPYELVLTITGFLPESSIACLALTCKSLYHSEALWKEWTKAFDARISPRRCTHDYPCYPGIGDRTHEYVTFVRLLRKDMPGHLLCDYCQRFHPRPQVLENEHGPCPTSKTKGMWLSWPKFNSRLRFEDVQGVMNASRWGQAHGPSLDSISLRTDWRVMNGMYGIPFLTKFDVQPMIASGNLMLRTSQRALFTRCFLYSSDPGGVVCWRIANDSTDTFKVCKHMDTMKESFLNDIRDLVYAQGSPLGYRQDGRSGTPRMQCASCFTHYSTTVFYHHHNPEVESSIEVVLTTWTNLGQCEHAFSPAWLTNAHHDNFWPARTIQHAQRIARYKDKKMSPNIHDICATERCLSAITHPSLRAALKLSIKASDGHTKIYHHSTGLLTEEHKSTLNTAQPPGRWERARNWFLAKTPAFLKTPVLKRRQS